MKRIFLFVLFCICFQAQAQYATIDAILTRLEKRKGINQKLKNVSISNKKFIQVIDFDDHVERKFIICNDNGLLTYVEVSDDKKTGKSTSKVYTGDFIKSNHNIVSIRANLLEGESISIPITKTLLLTEMKNILYLIDVNTTERWIEESSFNRKK